MGGLTMTIATIKSKSGKNLWDMNKEEIETAFAKATKQAQQELHAKGSPYIIGDVKGTYAVYPGGRKVFTPYKDKKNEGR
jgi:hypothetical protein